MIVVTVLALVIFSVVGYIHWLQKYSRVAELIDQFPSLGPYMPIIGHVWDFSRNLETFFIQQRKRNLRFNQTFNFWSGPYCNLNIVTAEDAEIILSNVKHIEKGVAYIIFEHWLNTGLLTSKGEKWRHRRKMLTPAFHYHILQEFCEVFGEQSDNLVQILREKSHESKVNIKPILTMMTLSTICETALGCKLDQNNKYLTEYCRGIHSFGNLFLGRAVRPELYPDFTYMFHPLYWRERKLVKYLHKFTADLIETRQKSFNIEDVMNLETSGKKSKKRLAMLDLMLYSKHLGEIDDAGIKEEVDTFVFEGHDTTAAGSAFVLLLLANHPDVQEQIIAELNEIFGDSDRHATHEDFQNMKCLERCIKESLRLYPSVPIITRRINEEVQLEHHLAPSGAHVWLHIWDILRDPKHFPDPEKFDPDRFLPEFFVRQTSICLCAIQCWTSELHWSKIRHA